MFNFGNVEIFKEQSAFRIIWRERKVVMNKFVIPSSVKFRTVRRKFSSYGIKHFGKLMKIVSE